jgi:hypothetical protein
MKNDDEKVLFSDKERSIIDSKLCRILEFIPMASFENNKITKVDSSLPYASILFECVDQKKILRSFITHKEDYRVLWHAFYERKINDDEEVLFYWSNKHYKNRFISLLSKFMPKMWVMICKKSSFEIMTNNDYRPELKGEARYLASKPVEEFKPDVMG